MQKSRKMIEILAHVYSSESTQPELSNEHQHDRVKTVFKNPCSLDECSLSIGRVVIIFLWCISDGEEGEMEKAKVALKESADTYHSKGEDQNIFFFYGGEVRTTLTWSGQKNSIIMRGGGGGGGGCSESGPESILLLWWRGKEYSYLVRKTQL